MRSPVTVATLSVPTDKVPADSSANEHALNRADASLAGDEIWSPAVLSEKINKSTSSLAKWRMRGIGPPFLKIGPRQVGYSRRAVEQWLARCERRSTLDQTAA